MKRYTLLYTLLMGLMLITTAAYAQPPGTFTADMSSSKIPSGVTLNDVDTLTGPVKMRFSLDLDATTYDNASQATAFNAIGTAAHAYILNTYLAAQGVDTANLSVAHTIIKNIDRRWDTFDHPHPLLQYLVAEDIYRVTGIIKYLVEE